MEDNELQFSVRIVQFKKKKEAHSPVGMQLKELAGWRSFSNQKGSSGDCKRNSIQTIETSRWTANYNGDYDQQKGILFVT